MPRVVEECLRASSVLICLISRVRHRHAIHRVELRVIFYLLAVLLLFLSVRVLITYTRLVSREWILILIRRCVGVQVSQDAAAVLVIRHRVNHG